MTEHDEHRAAALADLDGWRDRRDALVQAALTALIQSGSGVDFLAMQRALAAAFEEAARQEMDRFGAGLPWVALSRTATRLSAP
jgi:hypothetical protein